MHVDHMSPRVFKFNWNFTLVLFRWVFTNNWDFTLVKGICKSHLYSLP